MAIRQHQGLTRELREIIELQGSCVGCGLKTLQEHQARERYGPDFNVVRYWYDRSKQHLEGLIFDSTPNAIPWQYMDLMRQLVEEKPPFETTLNSYSTGTGPDRSSLFLTIPGVPENEQQYGTGHGYLSHPDDVPENEQQYGTGHGYLSHPDDVPPKLGWNDMSRDPRTAHLLKKQRRD